MFKRFKRFWPALLAMLALVILTAFWVGLGGTRVEFWLDSAQIFLAESGWWAVIPYILVFLMLGTAGVPPAILILPAAWAWPPWLALTVALIGGIGAATLGFLASRYLIQKWAEKKIPSHIQAYEAKLEQHGLSTVIVLRLLFFLFPPVTWLLGISHISLSTFLVGTLAGCLPFMVILVFTGDGVLPWLLRLPPLVLFIGALTIAVGFSFWVFWISRMPDSPDQTSSGKAHHV